MGERFIDVAVRQDGVYESIKTILLSARDNTYRQEKEINK